jgi:hypothetical protein
MSFAPGMPLASLNWYLAFGRASSLCLALRVRSLCGYVLLELRLHAPCALSAHGGCYSCPYYFDSSGIACKE